MRLCLAGEFAGNLDEAMRRTSFHLADELSHAHQVLRLDLRDLYRPHLWKQAKSFQPQIIHYIPGASALSFMLLKALDIYCGTARTLMSTMHPYGPLPPKLLFDLFKPDLVLIQAEATEDRFRRLGCRTAFLGGGVDTDRFLPVSEQTKGRLRDKYGIDREKFVILHVGSVKKRRNVRLMSEMQRENNQVILLGSLSTGVEKDALEELQRHKCWVWLRYFEHIEELYALADCYVFPTEKGVGSIEMPLSVLEAMACNLPVISTRFGALPRVFKAGDGMFYADTVEEFLGSLGVIKAGDVVKTREKVLPYAWHNVVDKLEETYRALLAGAPAG